jgi:hypothetical protein
MKLPSEQPTPSVKAGIPEERDDDAFVLYAGPWS